MTAILHTINKSPFSSTLFSQCLSRIGTSDSIVLLEDGVYGALNNHSESEALSLVTCYAIEDDIIARGLQKGLLLPHIELIDFKGFVDLTTQYSLTQSWY